MATLPDPRTLAFARIPPERCIIVANIGRTWGLTAAQDYATARGVPSGNILPMDLGASLDWNPGSNDWVLGAAIAVRDFVRARSARAVLLGPGCPNRVVLRGLIKTNEPFDPEGLGYPPFAHLVAAAPICQAVWPSTKWMASKENGSGRWLWYRRASLTSALGTEALLGSFTWGMGLTDNPAADDPAVIAAYDLANTGGINVLTPLGTQLLGDTPSRILPTARIGYGAWRSTSLPIAESSTNWREGLDNALVGEAAAYGTQPGPILAMLGEVTGSQVPYAAFANACAGWGYDVEYFYRATVNPTAETLCPASGAVWSQADFEGGVIVGAPYYQLTGNGANADEPQTDAPYITALTPVAGATVSQMGPSYGFEWGLRGLQSGAGSCNIDVTHRTSFEMPSAWTTGYHPLRGQAGIEHPPLCSTYLPAGDPLARPWYFDSADDSLPLIDTPWPTADRAPRRWSPRRLRA